jgi:transcriptional/translational regulatory protein YebC/TACO1
VSQLRNWNKEKKAYRDGRQRLDERNLRECVNIEGGVRSKVYQALAEELIKALRHEGRVPIAWVMVFAEPAQSRPEGSIDEPDSVLFPFVAQTVIQYGEKDLQRILTKAMNDWVEASFFDSGQDASEGFKAVGKL